MFFLDHAMQQRVKIQSINTFWGMFLNAVYKYSKCIVYTMYILYIWHPLCCPALVATYWRMEFSFNSILIKFLLAYELPTHRHSHRLKDIVETLTRDATTLSRLFWVFERVPMETGIYLDSELLRMLWIITKAVPSASSNPSTAHLCLMVCHGPWTSRVHSPPK